MRRKSEWDCTCVEQQQQSGRANTANMASPPLPGEETALFYPLARHDGGGDLMYQGADMSDAGVPRAKRILTIV